MGIHNMHATTHQARSKRASRFVGLGLNLGFALALLSFGGAASAQSAEKGKEGYVKHGCWQCHGFQGQGSAITGPKLAPDPKPLAFMEVFLRNTKGPMPPYYEHILSKQDLADIHAYLASIPKGPDYKSIPLLNQ
jgi:ubiquinol-cytochrome c reductase cytochrome c subunit